MRGVSCSSKQAAAYKSPPPITRLNTARLPRHKATTLPLIPPQKSKSTEGQRCQDPTVRSSILPIPSAHLCSLFALSSPPSQPVRSCSCSFPFLSKEYTTPQQIVEQHFVPVQQLFVPYLSCLIDRFVLQCSRTVPAHTYETYISTTAFCNAAYAVRVFATAADATECIHAAL